MLISFSSDRLRVECSLRAQRLAPALDVPSSIKTGLLYNDTTTLLQLYHFEVSPNKRHSQGGDGDDAADKPMDLFRPQGGVFEPVCLSRASSGRESAQRQMNSRLLLDRETDTVVGRTALSLLFFYHALL